MGLNIKNAEVERLAAEVAHALGVTKTEAIRQSLEDRAKSLGIESKTAKYQKFREYMDNLHREHPEIREVRITKEDYDALYE